MHIFTVFTICNKALINVTIKRDSKIYYAWNVKPGDTFHRTSDRTTFAVLSIGPVECKMRFGTSSTVRTIVSFVVYEDGKSDIDSYDWLPGQPYFIDPDDTLFVARCGKIE
jgi:hypothetical protein